jgi:hypothetical protein
MARSYQAQSPPSEQVPLPPESRHYRCGEPGSGGRGYRVKQYMDVLRARQGRTP